MVQAAGKHRAGCGLSFVSVLLLSLQFQFDVFSGLVINRRVFEWKAAPQLFLGNCAAAALMLHRMWMVQAADKRRARCGLSFVSVLLLSLQFQFDVFSELVINRRFFEWKTAPQLLLGNCAAAAVLMLR